MAIFTYTSAELVELGSASSDVCLINSSHCTSRHRDVDEVAELAGDSQNLSPSDGLIVNMINDSERHLGGQSVLARHRR